MMGACEKGRQTEICSASCRGGEPGTGQRQQSRGTDQAAWVPTAGKNSPWKFPRAKWQGRKGRKLELTRSQELLGRCGDQATRGHQVDTGAELRRSTAAQAGAEVPHRKPRDSEVTQCTVLMTPICPQREPPFRAARRGHQSRVGRHDPFPRPSSQMVRGTREAERGGEGPVSTQGMPLMLHITPVGGSGGEGQPSWR